MHTFLLSKALEGAVWYKQPQGCISAQAGTKCDLYYCMLKINEDKPSICFYPVVPKSYQTVTVKPKRVSSSDIFVIFFNAKSDLVLFSAGFGLWVWLGMEVSGIGKPAQSTPTSLDVDQAHFPGFLTDVTMGKGWMVVSFLLANRGRAARIF